MTFDKIIQILESLSESKVLRRSDRDLIEFLSKFDVDLPHIEDVKEWSQNIATQGSQNLAIAESISNLEDSDILLTGAILAALGVIIAATVSGGLEGSSFITGDFPAEITNSNELFRAAVGGSDYTFVSKFGADRSWNRASGHGTHKGVDLHVPYGTPVAAVFDGTVTVAKFLATADGSGCHSTAGNWIEITSLDGRWKARYMHLSAVNVKPGDKVQYGQKLGAAGWSGYQKGGATPYPHTESFVHLHFEVWHDGKAIDPERIGSELPNAQLSAYKGSDKSLQEVDKEFASKRGTIAQIMSYLQGKGLSTKQAAAITGNLMQESRLDYAPGMKWYKNSGSGATGLAQWLGPRKTQYKEWVRKHGGKEDLKTALDFFWSELQGTEKGSQAALRSGSVELMAVSFGRSFERYGKGEERDRAVFARYVYELYKSQQVSKPQPKQEKKSTPTKVALLDINQVKELEEVTKEESSFARNDVGESIFNYQDFPNLGFNLQRNA